MPCEHAPNEDHMICAECGQCREDLDSTDTCMDCGGVDENLVADSSAAEPTQARAHK